LAEAVKILARHNILSAPVVDVDAPEDASWIDRYIGIVEFAGIVVWILHQVRYICHLSIQLLSLQNKNEEKIKRHVNLKFTINFCTLYTYFNSKYV